MKFKLSKKTFWQSLISGIVLGIFILMAMGSLIDFLNYDLKYLGNGVYEETDYYGTNKTITTGERDDKGRWHGPVKIKSDYPDYEESTEEEVNMNHGARHGLSSTTVYCDSRITNYTDFYYMGNNLAEDHLDKAAEISSTDTSAYQVLGDKYPWHLITLNTFGFDSLYIKSYMDTLETLLSAKEFNAEEFNTYYGEVVDSLTETPYDSLITFNSNLTMHQGLSEMKNSEFRMAIIDRYWSNSNSTYNILLTTYPGYLKAMNDSGIVNQDFELFCHIMDSCMTSYSALNLEDPFFIDSIDSRIYSALTFVLNSEKSSTLLPDLSLKNAALFYKKHDLIGLLMEVRSILKSSFLTSKPSDVGLIVFNDMLIKHYVEADILRQSFLEAFLLRKGIIRPPTLATSLEGNNSATSVNLQGYVLEDGGSAVTSRGICWATFYNPTNLDNPISSETGIGKFNVTLSGLTEGNTYYARTFAINSLGTAYGNCIKFIAGHISGIEINKIDAPDFTIFPNPASASATFCFKLETSETQVLSIADMNGKIVFQKNLGSLSQGTNQVTLNLSNLPNGLYNCQLMGGKVKSTCKLAITH